MNTYDYSARYFDPALPRFTTVDPKAEKYYSISPYVYVANNPINAIYINGDSITITYRTGFLGLGGKKSLTYENGNLYNKDGSAYTEKVKGFFKDVMNGLRDLKNTDEGNSLVSELQDSKNVLIFKKGVKMNLKITAEVRR